MLARRHYAIPPAALAVAAVAVAVILMLAVAGCGSSAPAPTATLLPATNTPVPATATPAVAAAATAAPVATPTDRPTATAPAATASAADTPAPPATATEAPTAPPPASDAGRSVFTIGEGSVARYKVEEVLARTGFKVATGETSEVTGQVVFDADGNVVAGESRIAVQVGTLRTDSDRRDGYVRNRTLETDDYPEVVFQPNARLDVPRRVCGQMILAHIAKARIWQFARRAAFLAYRVATPRHPFNRPKQFSTR